MRNKKRKFRQAIGAYEVSKPKRVKCFDLRFPRKRKWLEIIDENQAESPCLKKQALSYEEIEQDIESQKSTWYNERKQEIAHWPIYKLLDGQQRLHVSKMAEMVHHHLVILDSSEAGTGKTHSIFGLAEQMAKQPTWCECSYDGNTTTSVMSLLIITVKPVLPEFKRLATSFRHVPHLRFIGLANLECAILGKMHCPINNGLEYRYGPSPFLDSNKRWKLPPRTLVVFDEAHRARNPDSQAFRLLDSLLQSVQHMPVKSIPFRILLASATMLENLDKQVPVIMYLMRMCPTLSKASAFELLRDRQLRLPLALELQVSRQVYLSMQMDVLVLHHLLFKGTFPCADGMKLSVTMQCRRGDSSIGLASPGVRVIQHVIRVVQHRMAQEDASEIAQAAEELWKLVLHEQGGKKLGSWHIMLMTKLRVLTEQHKVGTFVQLVQAALASHLQVIVMLNFDSSLTELYKRLTALYPDEEISVIRGQQREHERAHMIAQFQNGSNRICVLNMVCGGVGVSLHDELGTRPRMSFLSPPLSSTCLRQALGRPARNGSKSDAMSQIVVCSGTIEDRIFHNQFCKLKAQDLFVHGEINVNTEKMFEINVPIESTLPLFHADQRHQFAEFCAMTAPMRQVN